MSKNKTSKKINKKLKLWSMMAIILATAFIFTYSTYAWFRATLRVEINEFNITAEKDADLQISLDGINWSSEVTINKQTVINDLKKVYANHTNQWPGEGLWSVSSNGLNNVYSNSFALYKNNNVMYEDVHLENNTTVDLVRIDESNASDKSLYLAFDLFVKNGTPSPYGDYLYIEDTTFVEADDDIEKHNQNTDAFRIGFSITPMIDKNASVYEIQNITCNPGCETHIYEPNSKSHVEEAVLDAKNHGIEIQDDTYYSTYAVIGTGDNINIWSGVENSSMPIDYTHYRLQETITDETTPLTLLHDGILKMRVYVWIEAQDIDVIEKTNVHETSAKIGINFRKEMIK